MKVCERKNGIVEDVDEEQERKNWSGFVTLQKKLCLMMQWSALNRISVEKRCGRFKVIVGEVGRFDGRTLASSSREI